jgi:DNA polymerase I
MMEAYRSGDPYLEFGKQVGGLPEWATKETHPQIREGFKQTALGVQYGMSDWGLSRKLKALGLDGSTAHAKKLLRMHHEIYRVFWKWSEGAVHFAILNGYLVTTLGWIVHVDQHTRHRSLANFLMQANGSEMLRLACCLMIEAGLEVCGPIHDAVLLCAPTERIGEDVALARRLMGEASKVILNGFEVRTEEATFHYPDRYMDAKRGRPMWDQVSALVAKARERKALFAQGG